MTATTTTTATMTTPTPADALDTLGEMVRRERATLVQVARAEGLDAEDAVECVQDALCIFLGLAQRGEVDAPPGEWAFLLVGVTKNAARNRRRRLANERRAPDGHERLAGIAASEGGADDAVARAEAHVRLRQCVAELCAVQRAVVTLRLLDERPGDDVAAALGISRNYVDVLAHRARAALKICMTRNDR